MQNLTTSTSVTDAQEQISKVVLLYDYECYAAITHKYELPFVGVFKDCDGKFVYAIRQCDLLEVALDDYCDNDKEFSVPLKGFIDHRYSCEMELTDILAEFDSRKAGV